MSSQITTPLATYKILDAISGVRNITENVMDYYVELVSIVTNEDVLSYKYRVYVNFINGVKIVGDLYTYDSDNNTFGSLITTDQISGVILSRGKLYTTNGMPYYVNTRRQKYINAGVFLTSDSSNVLCINITTHQYNSTTHDIESFYYDTKTNEIRKTDTFIEPENQTFALSAYITCLYKDDDGFVKNGVFHLDLIPYDLTNKQLCYRITPKPTTSEGEQETAEPEPEA